MYSEVEFYNNIHNPVWRLNNLYKITNKEKQTIPFTPNPVQSILLKNNEQRYQAILKARQKGVSTYYLIRLLDKVLWNKNRTAVIMAHERDAIRKLFRIIRFAYDNLDERIKPKVNKGGGSSYEIYFPSMNSRIYCDLESRGDTISDLHISEMAFMKDTDKVNATMDAVPITSGNISIETTPNGLNHFHDLWNSSSWTFHKFFFPWYIDKEYSLPVFKKLSYTDDEHALIEKAKRLFNINLTPEQIQFRRTKIAQKNDIGHFLQEYPEDEYSCFLSSGQSVFDLTLIDSLIKESQKPIRQVGPINIYEEYNKNRTYVLGVDTAEGVNGDYSATTVICVETFKVVATIKEYIKPKEYAELVAKLGRMYTHGNRMEPLMGVERNNHGHAVILWLQEEMKYRNLYSHSDGRIGFKTDQVTRPVMLNQFIDAIESRKLKCPCKKILDECVTLVNNNGKIIAETNKHDDLVFSTSIALQMVIDSASISLYNGISSKILI